MNTHKLLTPVIILISVLMMSMIEADLIKGIIYSFGCMLYVIYLTGIKDPDKVPGITPAKLKEIKASIRKKVVPWKIERRLFNAILGNALDSSAANILLSQRRKTTGLTLIIAILGFFHYFTHSKWVDIAILVFGIITWLLIIFYVIGRMRRLTQVSRVAIDYEIDLGTMLSIINKYKVV